MLPFDRLDGLRKTRPLIHCIANLVSANDCANVLLAAGASPMMAQAPEEMEEIASISSATVLNTGTPDGEKFTVCRLCGIFAAKNQPVVLDPVGVGASAWRLKETEKLLESFIPSVIRVNLGEARALLHRAGGEQGVDSTVDASPAARMDCAGALALKCGTVVLLSGLGDVVTDGTRVCRVSGGSAWMARVTGTGVHALRPLRGVCRRGAGSIFGRVAGLRFLEGLRRKGGKCAGSRTGRGGVPLRADGRRLDA